MTVFMCVNSCGGKKSANYTVTNKKNQLPYVSADNRKVGPTGRTAEHSAALLKESGPCPSSKVFKQVGQTSSILWEHVGVD